VTVEVVPLRGMPEVRAGDDLAGLIRDALRRDGGTLAGGDIVVVTQKAVSKAEGRVVPVGPGGKAEWVERETWRVVARRGDLIIAETRHGFVCANAGVDESNVAEGFLSLLPEDPDGTADRIRLALESATGVSVGVIVTDTFGRPWRAGVVNVAIGCSGFPSLVDLRGTKDALGRELEVTMVAVADEVAAASGLVMGKSDGVPVAIVRGVRMEDPPRPATALIRAPDEDLFPQSPLEALHSSHAARRFVAGQVPPEAVREAVLAACSVEASDGTRPWLFVSLHSAAAKRRLMAQATGEANDALAGAATIVVPAARLPASGREGRDRDDLLMTAGAAVDRLSLALHAQGLASRWVNGPGFSREGTGAALGLGELWTPLGALAIGFPAGERPPSGAALKATDFMLEAE
jgi:coenzyme F420-0:L-glutamate ligase / coenzyme F420-1:gamma-L-glutamate ligase